MNINLINKNELDVLFPERIDAKNANEIKEEIFRHINENIKQVNIDMKNLKYISFDGMDIILELKLNRIEINLKNVYQGTYEVLTTYGFTNFTNVEKKYRFIDVSNLKIIGKGRHGTTYEIDDDLALKTIDYNNDFKTIEKEREFSKKAFISGVPSCVTYDIVETNEGYGIVFEKINGMTLGKYLSNHLEELDEYSNKFAEMLIKINSIELDRNIFDSSKEYYISKLEKMKNKYFKNIYIDKCIKLINLIPNDNKAVHMDYHPNNVIKQNNNSLMTFDLADMCIGNKFFDMVSSYLPMVYQAKTSKDGTVKTTSLKGTETTYMFEVMFNKIYKTKNVEERKTLYEMFEVFSTLRMICFLTCDLDMKWYEKIIIYLLGKFSFMPKLDKYIELFENNIELLNR